MYRVPEHFLFDMGNAVAPLEVKDDEEIATIDSAHLFMYDRAD